MLAANAGYSHSRPGFTLRPLDVGRRVMMRRAMGARRL